MLPTARWAHELGDPFQFLLIHFEHPAGSGMHIHLKLGGDGAQNVLVAGAEWLLFGLVLGARLGFHLCALLCHRFSLRRLLSLLSLQKKKANLAGPHYESLNRLFRWRDAGKSCMSKPHMSKS